VERLTSRDKKGRAYFDDDGSLIRGANGTFHQKKDMTSRFIHQRFVALDKAIDRLAAYEDTRLMPERVLELAKAEQDGRLMVLPCKKGDRLFVLTSDSLTGVEETKAKRIVVIYRENGPCAKVMAPCVYDDWGGAFREFYPEDFGKTVFLTREEAEAALSKQKEEQE